MLSLEECKKILNKKTKKYSDEEVRKISEYLDFFVDIIVDHLKSKSNAKNSDHLQQGFFR
jgi:ubiquitin C-terminal hydrolase